MAVVYSERYGYEIVFSPTLEAKLVELCENEEDGAWDELHDYIHDKFKPRIDTFHTDVLTIWGAIRDKEEAQMFDKEIQKAIRTWLKNYNASKGETK
jgi:hypothetical protein